VLGNALFPDFYRGHIYFSSEQIVSYIMSTPQDRWRRQLRLLPGGRASSTTRRPSGARDSSPIKPRQH
jgi:hypothetical protein